LQAVYVLQAIHVLQAVHVLQAAVGISVLCQTD